MSTHIAGLTEGGPKQDKTGQNMGGGKGQMRKEAADPGKGGIAKEKIVGRENCVKGQAMVR